MWRLKTWVIALLILWVGGPISAQDEIHECGFDYAYPKSDAYQWAKLKQMDQRMADHIKKERSKSASKNNNDTGARETFTIPIVFHLVTGPNTPVGTGANRTDETIYQVVEYANDAFANAGVYYDSEGTATDIRFCVASKNEFGVAQTGIVRTTSSTYSNLIPDQEDAAMKAAIAPWDQTQYINVWVVDQLVGIIGYAYLADSHGQPLDGVVINGATMSGDADPTRVFAHELGHYFNLYHTWQDGCTNNDCLTQGDRVCDTPPDGTTMGISCGTSINSCSTDDDDLSDYNPFRPTYLGGLGDVDDLNNNFMDYGNMNCFGNFTANQVERMHAALHTERASLKESMGCLPVYENDAAVMNVLAPADYQCSLSFNPSISLGNCGSGTLNSASIQYGIQGGPVYTKNWSGNLEMGEMQVITMDAMSGTPGHQTFFARITAANGTADQAAWNDEVSFDLFIDQEVNYPIVSNMEDGLESYWDIINPDGGQSWEYANVEGCAVNGQQAILFQNFGTDANDKDRFTIHVNLQGATQPVLEFDYAYAPFNPQYTDGLKVATQMSCGGPDYQMLFNASGLGLSVDGYYHAAGWEPTNCSHWKTVQSGLYQYAGQDVYITFENVNGGGNGIFIDNIRIIEAGSLNACDVPSNLQASVTGSTTAQISWSGATGAVNYELWYRPIGGNWATQIANSAQALLTGLQMGSTYEYRVRSICDGDSSDWSDTGTFTVDAANCNPPTGLNGSNVTETSASITWSGQAGALSYEVIINGASYITASTAYNFNNLTPGTTYNIQVYSNCGPISSNTYASYTFTTEDQEEPEVCDAATGLQATSVSFDSAMLQWNPVAGASSYLFRHRVANVAGAQWVDSPSAVPSVSLEGLDESTLYDAQVLTYCSNGMESLWGAIIEFETPEDNSVDCFSPMNLSSQESETSALISWTGPDAATFYSVNYGQIGGSIVATTSNTNSITLNALSAGSDYFVQVYANCGGVQSDFSEDLYFTTQESFVCQGPSEIATDELSPAQVLVTWSGGTADSFVIEYKLASSNTWLQPPGSPTAVGVNSLTLALDFESDYHLRLRGLCANGDVSNNSAIIAFSTSADDTVIPEPECEGFVSPSIGSVSSESVDVYWTPFGTFESYTIEYELLTSGEWIAIEDIANTNYVISGLQSGMSYAVKVTPYCANGVAATTSVALQFTTEEEEEFVCLSPSNVQISQITENSAQISWDAVPGGEDYQPRFREVGNPFWNFLSATTSTTAALTNLNSGSTYEVEVNADCGLTGSDFSSAVSFVTAEPVDPCHMPEDVEVSTTENSASFSWPAVPNAVSYTLRFRTGSQAWTPIANIPGNSYFLPGLAASIVYQYQVRTICQDGPTPYTNIATFETEAIPVIPCNAPSAVSLDGVSTDTAELTWQAAENAISYDLVLTNATTGNGETISEITGLSSILIDLEPETEYSVVLQSNCAQGMSAPSNTVLFTTEALPVPDCDPVTNLNVGQIQQSSALASWTANVTAESYALTLTNADTGASEELIAGSSASLALTGLSPDTNYQLTVQSNCEQGLTATSEIVGFTTDAIPVPDCEAATGLTVGQIGENTATVSWTSGLGANSYLVTVTDVATGLSNTIPAGASTSAALTGLAAGTQYSVTVQSNCDQGLIAQSQDVLFTTDEVVIPIPDCDAPVNLYTLAIGEDFVKVGWNIVPEAQGYIVSYRPLGGVWTEMASTTGNYREINGLNPGTEYEFRVKTDCGQNQSVFSEAFAFTTDQEETCAIVTGVAVSNITTSQALVSWTLVNGASGYQMGYRKVGDLNWQPVLNIFAGSYLLEDLEIGTAYELRVQAMCPSGPGEFSETETFSTASPSCGIPSGLNVNNVGENTANISWSAVEGASYYVLTINTSGSAPQEEVTFINSYQAVDLLSGTDYSISVNAVCGTSEGQSSPSVSFSTEEEQTPVDPPLNSGCDMPTNLSYEMITSNIFTFDWSSSEAGPFEFGFLNNAPGSEWKNGETASSSYTLADLEACASYTIRVRAICGTEHSDYTTLTFNTPGCEDGYCASAGNNAVFMWIESMALESINNASGNNGGYGDFTGMSTNLQAGESYTMTILAGAFSPDFDQQYAAWIDFNGNGQFDESTETLFTEAVNPPDNSTEVLPIVKSFVVPEDVVDGNTRLRVSIMYFGMPGPCDTFDFGEVEDYTVNLVSTGKSGSLRNSMEEAFKPDIYPNPTQDFVNVEFTTKKASEAVIEVFSTDGKLMSKERTGVIPGKNHFKVNMAQWNSSCYWVKVTMDEKVYTKRIMLVK